MLRSKRFPTIGIAHSQIAHRTPERQRQGDVWVNSGEDRVQLPLPVSKNVRKLPRSGLYVSAGHSTLQDNGPGTPPARTLQNSVRVQFSCSDEK
jgi:hypothetical protein